MKLIAAILFLFTIVGCSQHIEETPRPKNLIPKEKMVVIITELTKLESHIQATYRSVDRFHKVMTDSGDSLLHAHGVNNEQFESSMEYYGSRQDEMMAIYDQALDELNRELGELEK